MDGPFDTDAGWQPLSPRYAPARALSSALLNGVFSVIAIAAATIVQPPSMSWLAWLVAIGTLGWTVWRGIRAWRWVQAFGYQRRQDDLLIRSGLWSRALIAVPYGRMQAVRVHSGPLDRLWGLARVTLVTASAESAATIPGLADSEARRLRDELIEAGETLALPL
ncbi:MAG: PH domain-containing protein [Propionibacteriaceae bacterium]|nr:PH domain-containing protein [Propionibacteriaceae bacterium]